MKTSRHLIHLDPEVMRRAIFFERVCRNQGLDVLIYCTSRSLTDQSRLYRIGRSLFKIQKKATQLERLGREDLAELLMLVGPQYGKRKKTFAGPGQSMHNYAMAFDFCPMRNSKLVWGTRRKEDLNLWMQCGEIAESADLEWSGRWKRFKEMPHCQLPGKHWRDLIKQ